MPTSFEALQWYTPSCRYHLIGPNRRNSPPATGNLLNPCHLVIAESFLYQVILGAGDPVTLQKKCMWLLSKAALGAIVRFAVGAENDK